MWGFFFLTHNEMQKEETSRCLYILSLNTPMSANDQAYSWAIRKTQDKFEVSPVQSITLLPSQGTTGHSPRAVAFGKHLFPTFLI